MDSGIEPLFEVLVNQEGQYSLWPLNKTVPTGWERCGISGSNTDCMAYVDNVWTDMRPMSVRPGAVPR